MVCHPVTTTISSSLTRSFERVLFERNPKVFLKQMSIIERNSQIKIMRKVNTGECYIKISIKNEVQMFPIRFLKNFFK